MGEAIYISWTEDETSAELEGVLAGSVLPVARGARLLSGSRVVTAENMQERSRPEACRAICLPPLVNQERESDAGLLAKEARIAPVAQPDGSQARALLLEFPLVRAQLRDVLAAEHSAVMAEEDHNCGSISPQRAEPDVMAIEIGQNDARQLSAERLLHGGSFSIALAMMSTDWALPRTSTQGGYAERCVKRWCRGAESNCLRRPFQGRALPVSYPGTGEVVILRTEPRDCQTGGKHHVASSHMRELAIQLGIGGHRKKLC